jgi:hypothetical protein
MTQLTELSIRNFNPDQRSCMDLPSTMLAQLPRLRKLTLIQLDFRCTEGWLAQHKQHEALRELNLFLKYAQLVVLCTQPHFRQLESIGLPGAQLYEATMRALMHLPTLTALDPVRMHGHCFMVFRCYNC